MIKRTVVIVITIALLMNLTSCAGNKRTRYEAEFLVLFNTMTKIVAYTQSEKEFSRYSQLIYDNLKEYHELYDIYNDYEGINNIKTINDNAGISPVKVDQKIIDLLVFSKELYQKTDGKINIAFGSVLKIWHNYRTEGIENNEEAKLPSIGELTSAAEHTDINKVIIDEASSTVFLADPKMSLDVGAIAKGFAVEQVSQMAFDNGFTSGLISVGGNVRAIGEKSGGKGLWNIGVQAPDQEGEQSILETLYVKDVSIVTSGIYQRYYTVDGKSYHHIIDPNTLYPSEYFASITIVCRDSGEADALSTALFNLPFEQGKKLVESLQDVEALWVLHNGEMKYSEGFEKLLVER